MQIRNSTILTYTYYNSSLMQLLFSPFVSFTFQKGKVYFDTIVYFHLTPIFLNKILYNNKIIIYFNFK